MNIIPLTVGAFATNSYIVTEGEHCLIIDAPYPADRVIGRLERENLSPEWIILTHGHFDHIMGLADLKAHYKTAKTAISRADAVYLRDTKLIQADLAFFSLESYFPSSCFDFPQIDLLLSDGNLAPLGFSVISTPGHTKGSICLLNKKQRVLFSGDTLFRLSVGRTDLGGDYAQLTSSLSKLKTLDGDLTVLPGHGEVTSLWEEKENNPYLI